ncbi:MAG: hypothetical protein IPM63_15165 [Acidobacteriota bacterium]|nr:MAG: hypothetical protein IPM63_15165 [Acidobacteriota bacterium]
MNLKVDSMHSPDLPENGYPDDPFDFEAFVQAWLSEKGKPGAEVFGFVVVSPSRLAKYESGRFIVNTLVLEEFDWTDIKTRLEKLLAHTASAEDWDEVIDRLKGYLSYQH